MARLSAAVAGLHNNTPEPEYFTPPAYASYALARLVCIVAENMGVGLICAK